MSIYINKAITTNLLYIYLMHFLIQICFWISDNKLLKSLISCEPDSLYALSDVTVSDADFHTISTLADLYDRELVSTIGWAKQIPGKVSLCRVKVVNHQKIWHTKFSHIAIGLTYPHELKIYFHCRVHWASTEWPDATATEYMGRDPNTGLSLPLHACSCAYTSVCSRLHPRWEASKRMQCNRTFHSSKQLSGTNM